MEDQSKVLPVLPTCPNCGAILPDAVVISECQNCASDLALSSETPILYAPAPA